VRQRYDTGARYVLYVGTLQPRKNLETLVRAFARLVKQAVIPSDVRLVLAGRHGWLTEGLDRAIASSGCPERIVLPGYVAPEDLAALLSGAQVFVLPSWFEGFGLPVLEAMACGTPVLVADTSSLPEAAGDAGRCLPPHDEAAWTAALAQTMHDAAWRAEASERGRAWARQFTWARTAAQTVASYRRALGESVGNGEG